MVVNIFFFSKNLFELFEFEIDISFKKLDPTIYHFNE